MKYRSIGRTGLKVSEVAIGAWLTYGGTVAASGAEPIIKTALQSGVNYIDLADIYAKGEAERIIGEITKGMRRSDLVISSKVFWPMSENINDRGLSRKHIVESVHKSLKRLQTDYLDLYFCHRNDPDTPIEEVVRAMDDLVHQGKVLYWGTSVWQPDQIEIAVGTARELHAYQPSVEQPRYNMLDRHIEVDVMPACVRNGMGLTVWSPLAQGLLTGKYNEGVPAESRGGKSNWLRNDLTEENLAKVRKLCELAESLDLTPSQLALAWILRRPEISCVITGATSVEHVKQNVIASDVVLSDSVLKEIETILDNRPRKPVM